MPCSSESFVRSRDAPCDHQLSFKKPSLTYRRRAYDHCSHGPDVRRRFCRPDMQTFPTSTVHYQDTPDNTYQGTRLLRGCLSEAPIIRQRKPCLHLEPGFSQSFHIQLKFGPSRSKTRGEAMHHPPSRAGERASPCSYETKASQKKAAGLSTKTNAIPRCTTRTVSFPAMICSCYGNRLSAQTASINSSLSYTRYTITILIMLAMRRRAA